MYRVVILYMNSFFTVQFHCNSTYLRLGHISKFKLRVIILILRIATYFSDLPTKYNIRHGTPNKNASQVIISSMIKNSAKWNPIFTVLAWCFVTTFKARNILWKFPSSVLSPSNSQTMQFPSGHVSSGLKYDIHQVMVLIKHIDNLRSFH